MERNWIIIQTGEGKMPVLVAQNHPKGMFLTRILRFEFGPLSSGNENFFVCFCLFLAKNDGSCAKDVCFL
jgi:hypothetical protein